MAQVVIPGQYTWLEYYNFVVIHHNTFSYGQIGNFTRAPGSGYVDETYLKFDISSLIGSGVNVASAIVTITCNSKGSQDSANKQSLLYNQNKTNPTVWESAFRAPRYDDFTVTSAWDDVLVERYVNDIGVYDYGPDTYLTQLVQDWIDETEPNWGLIIDANFGAIGWGLSVNNATLTINYTGGVVSGWPVLAQQKR
jgi:hypothetical protein